MHRIALMFFLTTLAACAPFPAMGPALDAAGPDAGPPPPLLPIDGLLVQAGQTGADPGPALAARAARLKARATAISVDPRAP